VATVSITVTAVNDPPTANSQSVGTNQNTSVAITLTGSDVETAAAGLTFAVTVTPSHGSLTGTAPNLTYTPAADYSGADTFKFTVTDAGDGASAPLSSAEATVTINIDANAKIAVEQPAGVSLVNNTSTVDFGSVAPKANNSHTFVVKNIGGADLSGVAISFDGVNADEFTVTASPTNPIQPGGSTSFTVMFAPTALGQRTATMHISSNDPAQNPFNVALTGTGVTNLEAWRLQYFGSTEDTGDAADANDFDLDGIPNLLEFATGTNPTQGNAMPGIVALNGDVLEFQYSQAKNAINDGITFAVEWSDDLTTANWNSVGVTEVNTGEDDTLRHITASIPAGNNGRRLVRLRVTRPAQQ
jgi:hypothetical protein